MWVAFQWHPAEINLSIKRTTDYFNACSQCMNFILCTVIFMGVNSKFYFLLSIITHNIPESPQNTCSIFCTQAQAYLCKHIHTLTMNLDRNHHVLDTCETHESTGNQNKGLEQYLYRKPLGLLFLQLLPQFSRFSLCYILQKSFPAS